MTDEERAALNKKYESRNVLEELVFEANYHKATMSKNEAEFIRWLCGKAYELLKDRKPRLLTASDFDNNPNVDPHGYLPCWVECNDKEKATAVELGVLDPGEDADGWTEVRKSELPGGADHNPNVRFWTARPTKKQMEATAWR